MQALLSNHTLIWIGHATQRKGAHLNCSKSCCRGCETSSGVCQDRVGVQRYKTLCIRVSTSSVPVNHMKMQLEHVTHYYVLEAVQCVDISKLVKPP